MSAPRGRALASGAQGSAFAAVAAALAGAGWSAVTDTTGPLHGAAAVGFLAVLALPIGLAISAVVRLLWRAWRPTELAEALRDPATGGAPRLAAWLAYLILAALALGGAVLRGMEWVTVASSARVVHVLAAPILALAAAAILAALSRPAVDGLTRLLGALEARQRRRGGTTPFSPGRVVAAAAVLAVAPLALAWVLVVRPQVGHLDLSFLPALVVWLAVLLLAPLAWAGLAAPPGAARLRASARAALVAAIGLALAAGLAAAGWLRTQAPYAMLTVWGDSRLAGFAIDTLFDIEALRSELHLQEIRPAPLPGAAHPDILLVTIDTVRADRTPPYGGPASMPALARLATRGVVFDWAFAPGNVTRRSLPAMMIGVAAPRLRGRVAGWALKLDPRHVVVSERLLAAGYQTAGFFCCTSQFGAGHRLGLIRGLQHVEIEKDGDRLARRAARWLRARARAGAGRPRPPLFLWVHLIEPHGWDHSHPATAGARDKPQRYDRALTDADRALGLLIDAVWPAAAGQAGVPPSWIVVTSDHGEGLGDHGIKHHAGTLYNSEIRVPLVIAGPGVAARRVPAPVGLHDLAPTLLELAGHAAPGPPAMDGRSLLPLARGAITGEGEAYAAMIKDRSVAKELRAIVVGRHKLIVDGRGDHAELYDLRSDPGERRNLIATQPQTAARLRDRLRERRRLDRVDPF